MLVHRMVKDIKNSKVLHKIKTKDAYTAQQLYQQFKSQHLLDDRREYDEEDLMSAYPGLSKEEAKKLFDMLQRSTDAADLSLSKDNLIDAMGSGYTPVHVQKNRQGVFIVFKSDKDGKFYIVEKRSKQLFSVATSLAMAKRIIGETEDSKSKDADPRGYKVSDQIIKGFLIYKSGKGPATFFAKNENGKEFEGTMEQIKKQIDDYWVKQDEDVMKQKVRDEKIPYVKSGTTRGYIIEVENDKNEVFPWKGYIVTQKGKYYICKEKTKQEAINECKKYIESRESEIRDSKKVRDGESKKELEEYIKMLEWDLASEDDPEEIKNYKNKIEKAKQKLKTVDSKSKDAFQGVATAKPGKYFTGYRTQEKSPLFDNEKDAKDWCTFRMQRQDAKHISKCEVVKTSDSKTKDKAYHPRWRIKDDKLFKLRAAVKDIRRRVKDAELNSRAVWKKEDFDKMVASGNFVIVSKQPWGYEVRVKSGNIYGVEIKDSYTKGSADGGPGSGKKEEGVPVWPPVIVERDLKKIQKEMLRAAEKEEDRQRYNSLYRGNRPKETNDFWSEEYKEYEIIVKEFGRATFEFTIQKNGKDVYKGVEISPLSARIAARRWIDQNQVFKDKYTGDPLTKKGNKILKAMRERYGKKKGTSVFYASKNKGTISGVDGKAKDEVKYKEPIKPGFKPLNPPIDPDKREAAIKEHRKLRSEFKDRKTKDAGNPTTLLAKRSGWIGDFGYLPNMLIYLSLRPDGQVSVGANAPSKYGTNIPLSRIKQAIAKGDIEIGHRGEVDI